MYTKLPRSQTSLQVFQPFQKMEFLVPSSAWSFATKATVVFFSATEHSPQICLLTQSERTISLPVLETVSVTAA